MGKRANPTLIGGFLVGAVVLIVAALLLFGRGRLFTPKQTFVLFFDESVKGLNVGAPVDARGVRVGSVTDIKLQYLTQTGEFRIPVIIELEQWQVEQVGITVTPGAPYQFMKSLVERGLRAQLATESFVTGQLFIQLVFYPGTPVRLVGGQSDVLELPTVPTVLAQASERAQSVLAKIEQWPIDQLFYNLLGVTQGLQQLVNAPEAMSSVRALEETLATTRQLAQRIDTQVERLLDDIGGMSPAARTLLTDVQQLVRHLDARMTPLPDSVKATLDVAQAALRDGRQLLQHVDGRITRLSDDLTDTTKAAQTTLSQTQRTLDDRLGTLLEEVTAAARSIRLLADSLERNPSALVYGKGGDRR